MMKFALFLVCALVAVQGFQARSVDSVDSHNRAVKSIIDTIKAAIAKIKEIISNATSEIGNIIQNIQSAIGEVIGKIPELIEEIRKQIEAIVQNAGEIGRKCLAAQQENIDAVAKLAQDGMQACADEADANTEALRKQLENLVDKVLDLQENAVQSTTKCVNENKLNPIGLVNCLRALVEPISAQIADIQQQVANTIKLAQETAEKTGNALLECTSKVQQEVAAKEEKIINDIKECIASS